MLRGWPDLKRCSSRLRWLRRPAAGCLLTAAAFFGRALLNCDFTAGRGGAAACLVGEGSFAREQALIFDYDVLSSKSACGLLSGLP